MDDYENAYKLVHLAMGRANLQRGMSTARACGDWEWVRDNRPAMYEYEDKIKDLLDSLPEQTVELARELTSAPI